MSLRPFMSVKVVEKQFHDVAIWLAENVLVVGIIVKNFALLNVFIKVVFLKKNVPAQTEICLGDIFLQMAIMSLKLRMDDRSECIVL